MRRDSEHGNNISVENMTGQLRASEVVLRYVGFVYVALYVCMCVYINTYVHTYMHISTHFHLKLVLTNDKC